MAGRGNIHGEIFLSLWLFEEQIKGVGEECYHECELHEHGEYEAGFDNIHWRADLSGFRESSRMGILRLARLVVEFLFVSGISFWYANFERGEKQVMRFPKLRPQFRPHFDVWLPFIVKFPRGQSDQRLSSGILQRLIGRRLGGCEEFDHFL